MFNIFRLFKDKEVVKDKKEYLIYLDKSYYPVQIQVFRSSIFLRGMVSGTLRQESSEDYIYKKDLHAFSFPYAECSDVIVLKYTSSNIKVYTIQGEEFKEFEGIALPKISHEIEDVFMFIEFYLNGQLQKEFIDYVIQENYIMPFIPILEGDIIHIDYLGYDGSLLKTYHKTIGE